jgi:hypothetical protein
MRRFGSALLLDLKVGGAAASASVTPGASSVGTSFSAPSLKQAVGTDNYPLCRGIMTKNVVTLDQAASGGAALNYDGLFRINDSFNVNVPQIGLTHDRAVFTGPVAKHIAEFFALGYKSCDNARAQISASDGDTVVTLYTFLPFTNECVEDPEGFWPWVGWLRDMELTFSVAAATAIAAASTGAVSKATCTLTAWLETYPTPQLVLPAISQWVKYTTNAASGQNLMLLQNVGLSGNGVPAVAEGSRLAALIEVMSPLGLGGASTGDLFTSFGCPELSQDQTPNIDGFLTSFKSMFSNTDGSGDRLHTIAGSDTLNGSPFSSSLKFIPWRYMPINGRIEYLPKIRNSLTLNRGFTAAPTSGLHVVITNEIRELNADKQRELQAAAGVPANVGNVTASSRPLRPSQTFGHGRIVQTRSR